MAQPDAEPAGKDPRGTAAEPATGGPAFDADFLADLRCPLTLRPLVLQGDRLLCYESRKAYRIEDGIPVLLIEEATDIPEAELPKEFRDQPPITSRD